MRKKLYNLTIFHLKTRTWKELSNLKISNFLSQLHTCIELYMNSQKGVPHSSTRTVRTPELGPSISLGQNQSLRWLLNTGLRDLTVITALLFTILCVFLSHSIFSLIRYLLRTDFVTWRRSAGPWLNKIVNSFIDFYHGTFSGILLPVEKFTRNERKYGTSDHRTMWC